MNNRRYRVITGIHASAVSTKGRMLLALIATAMVSLGLSPVVLGQTNPSAIATKDFSGRVVNTERTILPFVPIVTTSTGKTWNTETDERGEFRIALPAGIYAFYIERPQYKSLTVREFPIGPAEKNREEFILEPGFCNDCEPIDVDKIILAMEQEIMQAIRYRDRRWLEGFLANDFVHHTPGGTETGKEASSGKYPRSPFGYWRSAGKN